MSNRNKQINLALNVMIALALVSIAVVVIKHYWRPHQNYRVAVGSKISLPRVDWEKNGQTLLLVLDTGCRYCTASAPFYQQIVRETAQKQSVRLLAVLPQDVPASKQYLNDLSVAVDEVRQSPLETVGVKGTPTLILVNSNAEVMRSWPGKLSPDEERQVLLQIGSL